MSATLARQETVVSLKLPRKLGFLMQMHPYKVAYGGRNSLKSHSFAGALLTLGLDQSLRILCAREVQKSLADSVHLLLKDKIEDLGYGAFYEITENSIKCLINDTMFRFTGLSDQTATSIKSFEGFDIAWIEEAQAVSKNSWQVLLPTIFRTPGSEIWVSFNPGMDSDETWNRFIVNPPPGAVIREMNWRDAVACGFFPPEQERLRQYDLAHSPDDYENIWEGRPRTVVQGAIYSREVTDMITDKRFREVPYDPRFPVHRVWDLGWNDLMTVIMVQKTSPSSLNVINYIEDSQITYAELLATMDNLRYAWGTDWMPHDAEQHDPKSGTNARKLLTSMGRKVQIIPRSDPEARIRAARMFFPRVYVDNAKHATRPDRPDRALGGGYLMDRLKRYKRNVPRTTGEPTGPTHDINSHGADAWGGLAEIVDRIRNDGDRPIVKTPGFKTFDSGMGMLG